MARKYVPTTIDSLHVLQMLAIGEKTIHDPESLSMYHKATEAYRRAITAEERAKFVYDDPFSAALMFSHHPDDRDLGRLIVETYTESPVRKFRKLANGLDYLMNLGSSESQTLSASLGMVSVPVVEEKHDSFSALRRESLEIGEGIEEEHGGPELFY